MWFNHLSHVLKIQTIRAGEMEPLTYTHTHTTFREPRVLPEKILEPGVMLSIAGDGPQTQKKL